MAGCEKCWSDAGRREHRGTSKTKTDHYHDLLEERTANPCTPEEQCGEMHIVLDWKDGGKRCVCGEVVERQPGPLVA